MTAGIIEVRFFCSAFMLLGVSEIKIRDPTVKPIPLMRKANVQVLDEADEMLNKGFADDVEHLMEGMPKGTDRPQTLLFSATEPPWVKSLAKKNLVNHHAVDLVGNSKMKLAEGITNVAVTATARQRSTMLADLITLYRSQHAIVFVNTKREADSLVAELGIIMKGTEALHGDVPQNAREKILDGFRSGRIPVLIATDVAARGLDIDHVDLVVHHGVPTSVENFIHRSGRTGRAGRKGTSLVMYDKGEQWSLNRIEKDAGIKFDKRGAPQPEEVMEASAFRAAANLALVNPELEPYFLPMAEKLMAEGGVTKMAQALAFMSGYKSPPSKRSLQTGEDDLRTVQLKPEEKASVEVRDVMRIVSGCLGTAGTVLSAADTRIGRIARCEDGSAVIDISPKGAEFLTETLKAYEGSSFYAAGSFLLPEELPDLFEEQRRGGYGGGGGGGGCAFSLPFFRMFWFQFPMHVLQVNLHVLQVKTMYRCVGFVPSIFVLLCILGLDSAETCSLRIKSCGVRDGDRITHMCICY